MPPLYRAVPLAEEETFAMAVEEDLSLDMTWSLQVLLDVDLRVPEVGVGLTSGSFEALGEVVGVSDHP